MTSSRVTSISRRRLSLLFMLLLLAPALWAASFRVAVVAEDEGCMAIILDALSVLSGDVTSPEAVAGFRAREERDAEIARARTENGYITSEDFESLEALRSGEADEAEAATADEEIILEVVSASISDVEGSFLAAGDREAYDYVMLSDDLDLLITAYTREEGLMTDLSLLVNGEEVYSSLYLTSEEDSEFMNILHVLLPYIKSPDTVIARVAVPPIVSVSIDGSAVTPLRSVIALERGEHEAVYTSPRFETVRETIYAEEGMVLSPVFVPLFSGPAFISSMPFDASLYYQGIRVEDHIVPEGTVPFSIAAQHSGFAPYSMQSTAIEDTISIELRPLWMEDADTIDRAKTRFYDNLLMTLVSFGAYVASGALDSIYSDAGLAPVAVAFTGISLVQLVELLDSMFDYFQMARMGG